MNKKKNNNHTIDKNYFEYFSRKFRIVPPIKITRRTKRKPITTRRTRQIICKHKNYKKTKKLLTNEGFRTKKIQKTCHQCSTTRHVKRHQIILFLKILLNNNSITHTIHQDLYETLLCDYCVNTKQLGFMQKKIKANCKVLNLQLCISQSTSNKNWYKLISDTKKGVQRKEKKWKSIVRLEEEKMHFDTLSKEENVNYMTSDDDEDSYETSYESSDESSDEQEQDEEEEVKELEELEGQEEAKEVEEVEVKEVIEVGEGEVEEKGVKEDQKKALVEIINIDQIEEQTLKSQGYIDLEMEYEKTEQKSDDEIEIISMSEKKILDKLDTKNNNQSKLMKNN
ncbi:hypothetical protein M0812_21006 [Anaeramoeba flamelloides]|uniref:Uncharacterized protein n=1 Tax=Anaeramoeba flamelloides TaxID=1746091 RepID=A0AAV7YQL7_9EUKA|nr:hypothetical protein M0812_21006 [Anaeramoeba flamelloides]